MLKYLSSEMDERSVAKLIVEVEEASDSTVLSRPALFRHREGLVEEYFPLPLPDVRVMVIDTEPDGRVNTTTMQRARYSASQITYFDHLINELRVAIQRQCPRAMASVATESALINEEFLPKPEYRVLLESVLNVGGFGLAAAHSGTVVSAFLPEMFELERRSHLQAVVQQLGMAVVADYVCKTRRSTFAAA